MCTYIITKFESLETLAWVFQILVLSKVVYEKIFHWDVSKEEKDKTAFPKISGQ